MHTVTCMASGRPESLSPEEQEVGDNPVYDEGLEACDEPDSWRWDNVQQNRSVERR